MAITKQRIKHWLFTLSGALFLWITLGNVAGHLLVYLGDNTRDICYPYWEMWGMIATSCEDSLAYVFWLITIELPRFFVVPILLVVELILGMLRHNHLDRIYDLINWLFWSLPTLWLVMIPGFVYWKRRSITIALIPILSLLAITSFEIIY